MPSFYSKTNAHNLQPLKGGCKICFLFLVFLFFCLFLPYFSFFLCFYKSQSLKIAHQLRCAANIYLYLYLLSGAGKPLVFSGNSCYCYRISSTNPLSSPTMREGGGKTWREMVALKLVHVWFSLNFLSLVAQAIRNAIRASWFMRIIRNPDPPTLAFLEKARAFPQKRKGFSLRGKP